MTRVSRGQQDGEGADAVAPDPEAEWVTRATAELRAAVEAVCQGWDSKPELRMLAQLVPTMISALVQGLAAERAAVTGGDGRVVSQAAQRVLQPAGIAFVRGVWRLRGLADVPPLGQRPPCGQCGGTIKLVAAARGRHLIGRFGAYDLWRPYYTCEHCGGGWAPADAVWGLGPGLLDPDMLEVIAGDGVRTSFDEAREGVWRHLQVKVDDNEA